MIMSCYGRHTKFTFEKLGGVIVVFLMSENKGSGMYRRNEELSRT